jgi:hypothetical protein
MKGLTIGGLRVQGGTVAHQSPGQLFHRPRQVGQGRMLPTVADVAGTLRLPRIALAARAHLESYGASVIRGYQSAGMGKPSSGTIACHHVLAAIPWAQMRTLPSPMPAIMLAECPVLATPGLHPPGPRKGEGWT